MSSADSGASSESDVSLFEFGFGLLNLIILNLQHALNISLLRISPIRLIIWSIIKSRIFLAVSYSPFMLCSLQKLRVSNRSDSVSSNTMVSVSPLNKSIRRSSIGLLIDYQSNYDHKMNLLIFAGCLILSIYSNKLSSSFDY